MIQPTTSEYSQKNCKISVPIPVRIGDVQVWIFNSEFAEHEVGCYIPLYSRAFYQSNYKRRNVTYYYFVTIVIIFLDQKR
jgi:hypothetical protein